jgi:hypothetical protein
MILIFMIVWGILVYLVCNAGYPRTGAAMVCPLAAPIFLVVWLLEKRAERQRKIWVIKNRWYNN